MRPPSHMVVESLICHIYFSPTFLLCSNLVVPTQKRVKMILVDWNKGWLSDGGEAAVLNNSMLSEGRMGRIKYSVETVAP